MFDAAWQDKTYGCWIVTYQGRWFGSACNIDRYVYLTVRTDGSKLNSGSHIKNVIQKHSFYTTVINFLILFCHHRGHVVV
jgi:hypothetical protein